MKATKTIWARVGLLGGVLSILLGLSSASAATYTVVMGNYFFNPTNLSVAQGDTVVWTNRSIAPHDSSQGASSTPATQRLWASPNVAALTGSYRFIFTNVGVYPYICAQHIALHPEQTGTVSVVSGNFPPAVALTAPSPGSRHPSPPSFVAAATASDSDGTVTNVLFTATRAGTDPVVIGEDSSAPFSVVVTNLNPASYQLRAVAYDDKGLTATSAVVNVLVAVPATLVLSSPVRTPQDTFQFDLATTLGLSYVVEESVALDGPWKPVITNSASGATLKITRPFETSSPTQRLYRALILP